MLSLSIYFLSPEFTIFTELNRIFIRKQTQFEYYQYIQAASRFLMQFAANLIVS